MRIPLEAEEPTTETTASRLWGAYELRYATQTVMAASGCIQEYLSSRIAPLSAAAPGLSRKLLEGSRRDRDNDELNGMHLQPDLA